MGTDTVGPRADCGSGTVEVEVKSSSLQGRQLGAGQHNSITGTVVTVLYNKSTVIVQ
mgnify:CR=1 FL=1